MSEDAKKRPKVIVTAADCRIETMRPGGNGGQNANKRDTAVRITHIASGAVGESREERSQLQNKHIAWKRMANHPKMRAWLDARLRALEEGFASTEAKVDDLMKPENLKVETGPEAAKCAPAEAECDAERYGPNVTRAHEGRGQGRGGL